MYSVLLREVRFALSSVGVEWFQSSSQFIVFFPVSSPVGRLLNCQHSAPSSKMLSATASYLEGCVLLVWCSTASLTGAGVKWISVSAEKGLDTSVQISQWTHVISCCRPTPRLPSCRSETIKKFHVTEVDAVMQFSGQMSSVQPLIMLLYLFLKMEVIKK